MASTEVLFRVKNATNKLNDYGAAILQRNTTNDKEKKISY